MYKPDDIVRVRHCEGVARVVKYIRKYGVYLLDRQMSVVFHGDGVRTYVKFWTFEEKDLREIKQ